MPRGNLLDHDEIMEFFLDSEKAFSIFDDLAKKHGIPSERINELAALRGAYFAGKIEVGEIKSFAAKAFGFDEQVAQDFSKDFIGFCLLPARHYDPDIESELRKLGGNISDYPEGGIKPEPKAPADIVDAILNEKGIELPKNLKGRLSFLTKAYLEGRRDRSGMKKLLMRDENIGGMNLTEDAAEGLLQAIDGGKGDIGSDPNSSSPEPAEKSEIDNAPIKEKESSKIGSAPEKNENRSPKKEKKKIAKVKQPSTLPVKAVTHALVKEVPVISGDVFNHEIQLPKKSKQHQTKHDIAIEDLANTITQKSWENAKGKLSKKALNQIIISGLRGIRNPRSIERLLAEKYKLQSDAAHNISQDIKNARDAYEKNIAKPKKNEAIKQTHKIDAEIEKRHYAALTKKSPGKSKDAPVSVRVSAARTKEEEQEVMLKKIPANAEHIVARGEQPKKITPKLSESSVHESKDGKQKVTDVVHRPKLMGPIEQLGAMSAESFRRSASGPEAGVDEMLEMLSLLEGDGYEKRIAGIKAWRKSPLNQLYLAISQQALAGGMSVAEAAAARRKKGEQSLRPSEIQAIMKFNQRTRF